MLETRRQPTLHLDADTSSKALHQALLPHGYDVTRPPNDWMPQDADDEAQLLGTTAHGRIIVTYHVKDFIALGQQYTMHAGIVLAAQRSWRLSTLISALERLIVETSAEEWIGQVRWLNQWRT
ncbi:MAG: hypothetical protein ETSY2_49455 [Candidatus Entotheonella gemina]|uniref:Uncharacterized protein n=1 Tax=Candidatus Entotheonella gemina TaxID=1429439 RepID=W4L987_9BACT|nr:MAG: hypothetical protein ETSY2_49455 [Candidatus Entotheonella gemina]